MPLLRQRLNHACTILLPAVLVCFTGLLSAQNSGMELHANAKVTASDIGLPAYPGATLHKDKDNDDAVDMGFSFGESHFRLMVASYVSPDAPDKILGYYRKPLSRYGEVLECNDGKPVGTPAVTRSGLTCSDDQGGDGHISADSNGHELRAGTPHQYRIVGIDKSQPKATRFALVYIQLPKDTDSKSK